MAAGRCGGAARFAARAMSAGALLAVGILAAQATTYSVGPGRLHQEISAVADRLRPGDVVEVEGNAVFGPVRLTQSGTATQPIVIRGTVPGAARPKVDAKGAADAFRIDASHYVIEDLVISNAVNRCVFLHGTNITLRRVAVHTCRDHGILGADEDTGDLTLSEVEVSGSGNPAKPELRHHPVYISTDHARYPRAVLVIERSWIHDNFSGNAIKSRARNVKVMYNWIEATNDQYHGIEMIGPDPWGSASRGGGCPVPDGRNDSTLCNGEIIGNVVISRGNHPNLLRLGGDGTGSSFGRYRIVNNTFVAGAAFKRGGSLIRAFGDIQSIEIQNNIFWIQNGDALAFQIVRDTEAKWVSGRRVTGRRNLITGSSWSYRFGGAKAGIEGLTETIFASTKAPIFRNVDLAVPDRLDLALGPDSPARFAGAPPAEMALGYEIPNPTRLPAFHPPAVRPSPGALSAVPRPAASPRGISLGAFD
jgi:hypothetical protein